MITFTHRPMAVGMTKAASTPCEMSQEFGDTLLMSLFLVSLPWRLQPGSKFTRPAVTWGWQDLDMLASRIG